MVWSDPLSLATTHGVSLPAGTEMFHFPAYPRNNKVPCRPMTAGGLPHSEILGSKPCWRLPEAYRILKRPSSVLSAKASTIRPSGRHTPRKNPNDSFKRQTTNHHTVKNDHKTIETNNRVRFEINSKTKIQKLLFCSRPLSSSQATTHRHAIAPAHGRPPGTTGIESRQAKSLGWRSGSPKAHPYHPGTHRTTGRAKPTTSSTPATPPPSHHATRGAHTVGRTSD